MFVKKKKGARNLKRKQVDDDASPPGPNEPSEFKSEELKGEQGEEEKSTNGEELGGIRIAEIKKKNQLLDRLVQARQEQERLQKKLKQDQPSTATATATATDINNININDNKDDKNSEEAPQGELLGEGGAPKLIVRRDAELREQEQEERRRLADLNSVEQVALMEALTSVESRIKQKDLSNSKKDNSKKKDEGDSKDKKDLGGEEGEKEEESFVRQDAKKLDAFVTASFVMNAPLVDLGAKNRLRCVERLEKAKLRALRRIPRPLREEFEFVDGCVVVGTKAGQVSGVSLVAGSLTQYWFNGNSVDSSSSSSSSSKAPLNK
jgi:hypothetical protein